MGCRKEASAIVCRVLNSTGDEYWREPVFRGGLGSGAVGSSGEGGGFVLAAFMWLW